MKTLVETGHIFYLDKRDQSRMNISHLWQWNTSGALSLRYETIDKAYREERFTLGMNLYF
jgi:hypothetical protein